MRSSATSVADYLRELPEDRRTALETVRRVINDHLPPGYEEAMNWGMITWQVPLETCPDTYNGQPLMCAALASQKRYMAVHLMGIYTSPVGRVTRSKRRTARRASASTRARPACGSASSPTCRST